MTNLFLRSFGEPAQFGQCQQYCLDMVAEVAVEMGQAGEWLDIPLWKSPDGQQSPVEELLLGRWRNYRLDRGLAIELGFGDDDDEEPWVCAAAGPYAGSDPQLEPSISLFAEIEFSEEAVAILRQVLRSWMEA
jgi:hypothetical protein